VKRLPHSLVARTDGVFLDARAETVWRASSRQEFRGGACGVAEVDLYDSTDWACHGGFVLRIRMRDHGCATLPWARNIPGGVELHLGGEDEADVLAAAIIQVLAQRGVRARITHASAEAAPSPEEPVEAS